MSNHHFTPTPGGRGFSFRKLLYRASRSSPNLMRTMVPIISTIAMFLSNLIEWTFMRFLSEVPVVRHVPHTMPCFASKLLVTSGLMSNAPLMGRV